jgi:PKD repeat protein
VASFTVSCANLVCQLDGRGSTDDGSIVRWSWDLGKYPDGSATGSLVTATYPHTGLRTVTLTVTDNTGKTASISKTFTVN